jgi:hypothetical protein
MRLQCPAKTQIGFSQFRVVCPDTGGSQFALSFLLGIEHASKFWVEFVYRE